MLMVTVTLFGIRMITYINRIAADKFALSAKMNEPSRHPVCPWMHPKESEAKEREKSTQRENMRYTRSENCEYMDHSVQ